MCCYEACIERLSFSRSSDTYQKVFKLTLKDVDVSKHTWWYRNDYLPLFILVYRTLRILPLNILSDQKNKVSSVRRRRRRSKKYIFKMSKRNCSIAILVFLWLAWFGSSREVVRLWNLTSASELYLHCPSLSTVACRERLETLNNAPEYLWGATHHMKGKWVSFLRNQFPLNIHTSTSVIKNDCLKIFTGIEPNAAPRFWCFPYAKQSFQSRDSKGLCVQHSWPIRLCHKVCVSVFTCIVCLHGNVHTIFLCGGWIEDLVNAECSDCMSFVFTMMMDYALPTNTITPGSRFQYVNFGDTNIQSVIILNKYFHRLSGLYAGFSK